MASKLTNKIFIDGTIECLTGLRVGGNKSSLEIGGVDLNIIKGANGIPYIPGSSLKGKLRSLLAKMYGWQNANADGDLITSIFGGGGGKESGIVTRLFVRDLILDKKYFEETFPDRSKRDFDFSETKTENVINRSTGKAEHPRTIERIPAGSRFFFSLVLDVYEGDKYKEMLDTLKLAIQLLHYDYLGGHGSRGSGKVRVIVEKVRGKQFSNGLIQDMSSDDWSNFVAEVNRPENESV